MQLIVSGKVQGVFFRRNVGNKALELGLKGFAKNLENGNVEVAAQGTKGHIEALKQYICSNLGNSRVEKITEKMIVGKNYSLFEIL